MEYVDGKIYKDPGLPDLTPDDRERVYSAMNKTIAKIHSVDINEAGIADYGKHGTMMMVKRFYLNYYNLFDHRSLLYYKWPSL